MKKGEKYKCVSDTWSSFTKDEIYNCIYENVLENIYNIGVEISVENFKDFELVIQKKEIMKIEKGNSYLCLKSYNGFHLKYGNIYLCNEDNVLDNVYILENDRKDFKLVTDSKIPTHYQTKSGYDVIDFCNDNNLNFNRGSAVKYIARAGKKDDEIKDLEKAIDVLQREIKFLKDEVH